MIFFLTYSPLERGCCIASDHVTSSRRWEGSSADIIYVKVWHYLKKQFSGKMFFLNLIPDALFTSLWWETSRFKFSGRSQGSVKEKKYLLIGLILSVAGKRWCTVLCQQQWCWGSFVYFLLFEPLGFSSVSGQVQTVPLCIHLLRQMIAVFRQFLSTSLFLSHRHVLRPEIGNKLHTGDWQGQYKQSREWSAACLFLSGWATGDHHLILILCFGYVLLGILWGFVVLQLQWHIITC